MHTLELMTKVLYPNGLNQKDTQAIKDIIKENEKSYDTHCTDFGIERSGTTHFLFMMFTYLHMSEFFYRENKEDLSLLKRQIDKLIFACDEIISGKCNDEMCDAGKNCRTTLDIKFAEAIKKNVLMLNTEY